MNAKIKAGSIAGVATQGKSEATKTVKKATKKPAGKASKKTATKKPTAVSKKNDGTKALGVGEYAKTLLGTEADVDKVLAAVLKKFPTAKTTKASIYWYRSQMNQA